MRYCIPPALAVFLILSLSACRTRKGDIVVTMVTTGILKGNMTSFERDYSRGRVRYFGDPPRMFTLVESLVKEASDRDEHPLVVDLGDDLSGSAEALYTKGAVLARLLGDLSLSACLLGNLEFAHGQKALTRYATRHGIPFLSTNLLTESGGRPSFSSRFIEKKCGAVKILFSGLSPTNLEYLCLPADLAGLRVIADVEEVFRLASGEKRKRGCDLLVMLTQLSLSKLDPEIATALEKSDVDILLGLDFDREGGVRKLGHTYLLSFPGRNRGQRVRESRIEIDPKTGRVTRVLSSFFVVDSGTVKADERISAYFEGALQRITKALDKPVGRAHDYFSHSFFGDGDTGNLVTDAMREASASDIALINSGSVVASINKGPVLLRDLYRVLPYQNRVVTCRMNGARLRKLLIESLSKGATYQVSGISMKLRGREGSRGFILDGLLINGKVPDKEKIYSVALSDFLAARLRKLLPGSAIDGDCKVIRDLVKEYINRHSPIKRPARGRIVINFR